MIEQIEATLAGEKPTPDDTEVLILAVECAAIEKLHNIREALTADKARLRVVFLVLFQDGLTFKPAPKTTGRRVWWISGKANLGAWSNSGGSQGSAGGGEQWDPNETRPGGVLNPRDPQRQVSPLMIKRIIEGLRTRPNVAKGHRMLPSLLPRSLEILRKLTYYRYQCGSQTRS